MNLIPTIKAVAFHARRGEWKLAASCVKAWGQSIYEGARRYSPFRGYPYPRPPQDARWDITEMDRLTLIERSRWFEANDAIVNRMADLFEQFVIGANGLQLIPASSDEKWNRAAKEYWDETAKLIDVSSRMPLSTIQTICARREFIDGEILVLKTAGDETLMDGRVVRRPRIQLVEAHRIKSPDRNEKTNIIDGWEVDSRGRPIAVWISETQTNGEEKITRKDANQVIVIGEPCRQGQYHPLPYPTPVINDLVDLSNLQQLGIQKAKDAAVITNVIKNASGEIPKSPATLMRERHPATTTDSSGEAVDVERTKFLQTHYGPHWYALKKGDDMSQFGNDTPSVADQALWNILTSRVCVGVGIPKILVFPESVQGTVARGEYDIANAFFRSRSAIHAAAWTEVYLFVMDFGIKNDPRLKNPPADWRKVTTRPPRAVNVDVGRNSAAMLAELDAAATNYDLIYGPLGLDAETEIRKAGKFAKLIRTIAEEEGVTPGEIRMAAGEALAKHAESVAKEQERNASEDNFQKAA